MKISEVSQRSGLSTKTIRYYESIALISPARREGNGYRTYSTQALQELRFLARARQVGFDLQECRQLLDLLRNPSRKSVHARNLVLEKEQAVSQQLARLRQMQKVLKAMASRCNGDEGPECAILDDLASGGLFDE